MLSRNGKGFLRVYGVSAEAWARRYGIEPFEGPCQGCGKTLRTSVPFVITGTRIRWLEAPPCDCGNEDRIPYCFVGMFND